MLTVRELKELAARLSEPYFCRQVGPYALVQRPPRPVAEQLAVRMGLVRTVTRGGTGSEALLPVSLLLHVDSLRVATPPQQRQQEALGVGRRPDCELPLTDVSVSTLHAVLRWHAPTSTCCVTDLQSTHGTHLNGQPLTPMQEHVVRDGDVLSFGEVDFGFFVARSLWARLAARAEPARLHA
jgi:pSer/pThr/pTyr-binding forkhead associated (FHA) protein